MIGRGVFKPHPVGPERQRIRQNTVWKVKSLFIYKAYRRAVILECYLVVLQNHLNI